MKLLAIALAGAFISSGALAQDSTIVGSTVMTTAVTALAPVVLLAAITVAAEDNEAATVVTAPSATSTAP